MWTIIPPGSFEVLDFNLYFWLAYKAYQTLVPVKYPLEPTTNILLILLRF